MPHDLTAEKGLLGSMMTGGAALIEEAQSLVHESMLYSREHQIVFGAVGGLNLCGVPVDLITLTDAIVTGGALEQFRGDAQNVAIFLTDIYTTVPTAANFAHYAEIVREKYMLREIITQSTEAIRRAYEEQDDVNGLLDNILSRLNAVAIEANRKDALRHVKEGVQESINRLEIAFDNRGQAVVSGLATGFVDIDRMLSGMKPSQFIVIAARPSHGKTALAMNIAEHVALNEHVPVAVFSLEMSYQELIDRMLCSAAGVSLQRLRDGFMAEADFPRITNTAQRLMDARIYIDDTPSLRLYEFKARARQAVRKLKAGLVVVDYLQLMQSPSRRAQENRAFEITEISAALKATAKELAIPVIALAQLNRDPEKRSLGTPKLSDLRESGAIEQDADVVGLLNRPVRLASNDAEKESIASRLKILPKDLDAYAELNIAKQRNGPVGDIQLRFVDELTRFQSTTQKQWSNNPDERQQ